MDTLSKSPDRRIPPDNRGEMERRSVRVDYEGRSYTVLMRGKDFRIDPNGPVHIYNLGFGLTDNESPVDQMQLAEAKKHQANFVGVGIREIPQPYDTKSDRTQPPNSDVDARIILEAFRNQGIDIVHAPVTISGFSEGAAVATALAGQIDSLQLLNREDTGSELPRNTLRLWSLTGVIDQRTDSENMSLLTKLISRTTDRKIGSVSADDRKRSTGVTILKQIIREFSVVGLYETAERYRKITGNEPGPLSTKDDIKRFMGDVFTAVRKMGIHVLVDELKASKAEGSTGGGNIGNLIGVMSRCRRAEDAWEFLSQLKKMEVRNPVCDALGDNWRILMALPAHDTIYPWSNVLRTMTDISRQRGESPQTFLSHTSSRNHSGNSEFDSVDTGFFNQEASEHVLDSFIYNRTKEDLEQVMKDYLFSGSDRVHVRVIGNHRSKLGEYGIEETHVGPANAAMLYLDATSLDRESTSKSAS